MLESNKSKTMKENYRNNFWLIKIDFGYVSKLTKWINKIEICLGNNSNSKLGDYNNRLRKIISNVYGVNICIIDLISEDIKVGLSPSKKICLISLIESPLKLIKNAFYFILKAIFVLKIFKFLSWLFGHAEKTIRN